MRYGGEDDFTRKRKQVFFTLLLELSGIAVLLEPLFNNKCNLIQYKKKSLVTFDPETFDSAMQRLYSIKLLTY